MFALWFVEKRMVKKKVKKDIGRNTLAYFM